MGKPQIFANIFTKYWAYLHVVTTLLQIFHGMCRWKNVKIGQYFYLAKVRTGPKAPVEMGSGKECPFTNRKWVWGRGQPALPNFFKILITKRCRSDLGDVLFRGRSVCNSWSSCTRSV